MSLGSWIWPELPERVLGTPIPPRFRRGLRVRLSDPDRVLIDFIGWLEDHVGRQPPSPPPGGDSRDVDALVTACIEVADRVPSEALAQRLQTALAKAGIRQLDPTGQPFDPTLHQAVEKVPTRDPNLHNVVAATDRVGYFDGVRRIRVAEVAVYRYEGRGNA